MNKKMFELWQQQATIANYCESLIGIPYGSLPESVIKDWEKIETSLIGFDEIENLGLNCKSLESLESLESLDCVTFVENVLAASLIPHHAAIDSKTDEQLDFRSWLHKFKKNLQDIRYYNKPVFIQRKHFMSLDWIPNNIKKNFCIDITNQFPAYKLAVANINKFNWLMHHSKLELLKEKSFERLESELLALTKSLSLKNYEIDSVDVDKEAKLPYLELNSVLANKNNSNYMKKFSDFNIISIVRPNWQLKDRIGTNLNVSHLGIAIRQQQNNTMLFYHASSAAKANKVVKIDLHEYLQLLVNSPTIKGINVLKIGGQ